MKTLAELRALESDLVARAAAKLAEIKDDLAPDALRAIETAHDALLDEYERVRSEIAAKVEAERTEAGADVLKADRERASTIRKVARQLGLPEDIVDQHVERGTSANAFRQVAIDEAAKRQQRVEPHNPHATEHRTYAEAKTEVPKGTSAARAMIALAATRGDRTAAAAFVTHHYGRSGEMVARALSTSVGVAGGFLVPDEMSNEVIELLRPKSVVLSLNPVILPMPRGNMTIPRQTGGASANYVGENQPAQASQPTFGMVQLSAKKLISLVPVSNDMIRFPSIAIDGIVRDDMVKSIATRSDLAFIRSPGSQFSPRGLASYAADPSLGGTHVIQATATANLTNVDADAAKVELALEQSDVAMDRPGWIMSPRTKKYLENLKDGLGNKVYAAEMAKGLWRGAPFRSTTQVPNNLPGTDAAGNPTLDASELYLADFAEVIVGDAFGLEIEVFNGAAYIDAAGQMQSGVSNDQMVMRAIIQHDMNMRQIPAVAMLANVRWF